MIPDNERTPYWIFFLTWKETRKSDLTGEPITSEFAEPLGPYKFESDAHDARLRYLASTGWMPSGGHDPEVSQLQRCGPPDRTMRHRLKEISR